MNLDATGAGYQVDDLGNATGGIRTPQVDAAVAKLTGLGQTGTSFCGLFGTTTPLSAEQLKARYGDHDAFVKRFTESTDKAVAAKTMLKVDADRLVELAKASDIAR
jgi:hypothetical protein